jgi:hypothetical protein
MNENQVLSQYDNLPCLHFRVSMRLFTVLESYESIILKRCSKLCFATMCLRLACEDVVEGDGT